VAFVSDNGLGRAGIRWRFVAEFFRAEANSGGSPAKGRNDFGLFGFSGFLGGGNDWSKNSRTGQGARSLAGGRVEHRGNLVGRCLNRKINHRPICYASGPIAAGDNLPIGERRAGTNGTHRDRCLPFMDGVVRFEQRAPWPGWGSHAFCQADQKGRRRLLGRLEFGNRRGAARGSQEENPGAVSNGREVATGARTSPTARVEATDCFSSKSNFYVFSFLSFPHSAQNWVLGLACIRVLFSRHARLKFRPVPSK